MRAVVALLCILVIAATAALPLLPNTPARLTRQILTPPPGQRSVAVVRWEGDLIVHVLSGPSFEEFEATTNGS